MAPTRKPQEKTDDSEIKVLKPRGDANELTKAMVTLLLATDIIHDEKIEKAKRLISASEMLKAMKETQSMAIDFDKPACDCEIKWGSGEKDMHSQGLTLSELVVHLRGPLDFFLLMQTSNPNLVPNLLWLAVGKNADMLSDLLTMGKFDVNQACSYKWANDENVSLPLKRALRLKSYPAVFTLLVHDADPITKINLEKGAASEAPFLGLLKAARELRSACDEYKDNKFSNVLIINALFAEALLHPHFLVTYLSNAARALNSASDAKTLAAGYPNEELLKHFIKMLYHTLKWNPDAIKQAEARQQLRELASVLEKVNSDEKSAVSAKPSLFETAKKKEKVIARFKQELPEKVQMVEPVSSSPAL